MRARFWPISTRALSIDGKRPLVVVTATDVLGSRARHPQPMAKAWSTALDEPDIPEPGNIVVHLQRGLAKLDGLDIVETGQGPVREMVRLKFSGNARCSFRQPNWH